MTFQQEHKSASTISSSNANNALLALVTIALFVSVLVNVLIPNISCATEQGQRIVPDYRYPADTSGPGLRLVSLLHDTRSKVFAQGVPKSKDKGKRTYFARPRFVALGNNGEVYTLDGARGVIYQMTYAAGALESSARFPKNKRRFLSPIAIAVAPDGSIWLTDSRSKAVFVLDASGELVDSLTGAFVRPVGIAYNEYTKRMLVTDLASNTITEISLSREVVATHGAPDSVVIEGPSFVAVGPSGDIYIVEALGGGVAIFSPNWKPLRKLGGFGDGPGFFSKPKGIAVDGEGRVYVADALFDNVQIFDKEGRLLLTLGASGSAPGQFVQPMGIAIGTSGDIYIADSYNGRVQVFRWENISK